MRFLTLLAFAACVPTPPPAPAAASVAREADATPLVDTVIVAKSDAPAAVAPQAAALALDDTDCNPKESRCLWMEPKAPKPGDLVMYETNAETGSASLNAFGKEVPMFRVGDRLRAYVGVPLSARAGSTPTQLWLDGAREVFQCTDTPIAVRELEQEENLKVARRFTRSKFVPQVNDEPTSGWVQPLPASPFSLSLFLWPRPGDVTSRFFVGRTYNKRMQSRHMGLDIQGTVGERVFSTQAGVVRFSGKQRATGLTLVIDHGGGVLSFYMHLSKRLKKVGEKVEQGELIALVGKTGRVTGPHLHFAVSVHGRFVDPEQVLSHPLYASETASACRAAPSTHSVR